MLLHVQAGILGKAVGSSIAPPYLLCRNRAALWLVWAILAIASRPFGYPFYLHRSVMANSALETTEDFQEKQIWREEMEQQVQVENANDGEPQENFLIVPSWDESDVPEAIGKMMNNGVKFTQS